MEPVDRDVCLLSSPTFVTVPTFDFKSMVLSLVRDKELMSSNNFIPNFDIFAGKETTIGPATCGDIHTGDMYKLAWNYVARKNMISHFPLSFFMTRHIQICMVHWRCHH